jgi:uncharacterized phage protein gp47/JayE
MEEPKLIERPYQEIADDVLTAIVGGVVNEPHIFDVRVAEYSLSEPADPLRGVRGITGTANKKHRTFQPGTDYHFVPGTDTEPAQVRWLMNGGVYPDHGTEFLVDYYRPDSPSPLTDINVGSVTRTLAEAVSRELAIVYEQINLAYLSGFIDWATAKSLDFVVAILGVTRKTADFAEGTVTFFRAPNITGAITINAGVKLTTSDGRVTFETTNLRTLQPGQNRINVPVRATVAGDEGIVPANQITQLLQLIAGIDRVTNFDRTRRAAADESDEALRKRAKARLRGLNQCTIPALEQAARAAGAKDLEIRDPQYPSDQSDKWIDPGKVQVLIKGDPDYFDAVRGAIEGVRAAGVWVQVIARQVFVKPRLQVKVAPGVTPAGRVQIKQDVVAAVADYVATLTSGDAVSGPQIQQKVAQALDVPVPGLEEVAQLRDVMVWLMDPDDPVQPGERVPRRDLLVHDGQPATDSDIQSWEFEIQTQVDGKKALPVLDFTPDDIALTE